MHELATTRKVIRFGLFEADLVSQELRKSGIKIKIQEQPFQILAMLLERPGEIITREEIQKRLWAGDTFVDFDLGLNSAVKKLRQALGDESDNPRFVETLYRRGYRFLAPIQGATLQPTLVTVPVRTPEEENGHGTISVSEPAERGLHPQAGFHLNRGLLYLGIPAILLAGLFAGYGFRSPSLPRITGYREITHDGLQKYGLATDGNRLYLEENNADHYVIAQVSKSGGETSNLPTAFTNALLGGILPDGSALLIGEPHSKMKQADVWSLPLPAGAPRRLGGVVAQSGAPSPDGKSLVFANGNVVYQASIDGTRIHPLFSTNGNPASLAVSPDGRQFCFTLADLTTGARAIWEANWDGTHLHPLFPVTGEPLHDTSPQWTPDGKYLLFERFREGHNNIWALPLRHPWLSPSKPIQLTNGPLDFGDPLPSRDGKTIFVVGSQPRSELVRYDGATASFKTYLDGKSITDVAFSSDGQWMTYVTVPDKALWRSRIDGSERLQLTDPGAIGAALPRWSPDGKQLVFMGHTISSNWRAYLISSDGGKFEELVPSVTAGIDPNWMPDGKSILVSLSNLGPTGQGISQVDLATREVTDLPGSERYFSPRPSPDGKTIIGITTDTERLALFDVASKRWTELLDMTVGYPSWSRDGQYIYFETVFSSDPAFCRMRVSDHKVEKLASLSGIRRYWGDLAEWLGTAPDGSLLLTRDASNQEVYAIDWSPN
jgi:Tol biopolymer transport system component/DNA-binding winged helix-turn-helix (wHTH) protein